MEWLRWIVLLVGLLVIGGIVWMYRRHRSEQAVDLGGGRTDPGGYHDPIDASVGARADEETADEARREPQLELGGNGYWSKPDKDGFIDGVSEARVVWRAEEGDERATPSAADPEPVIEPEDVAEPARSPGEDEEAPEARPKPGFSSLFTRQGQQASPTAAEEEIGEAPTAGDGQSVKQEPGEQAAESDSTGAVISMMIVDRDQAPMPPERVRRAIEESGFAFGEFSIYHFQDLEGQDWFSLMNAVSPGQFDPDDLSSFETPALALFMQLPVRGGADASLVFERMHQVASSLAESLGAMLIDDRREPLDSESIDRYRELIEQHG